MEDNPEFNQFLQSIYNKVCIAVAIYVVRSKPDHLSLDEYIKEIRENCLRDWKDKNEGVFEKRILSVQRDNQIAKINNFLPMSQDVSEFGSEDWFPNLIDDVDLPNAVHDYDSSSDNSTEIDDNAKFMNGLIKLKFAVNTRDKLTVKRTKSIVSSEKPFNQNSNEADSGFDSFGRNSNNSYDQKTYSTCLLRYVTNSEDTDVLISKYLESIFNYVKKLFNKHTMMSFNYWKDSTLEKLFSVLREVSSDEICSDAIVRFIENTLEDIWKCEEINKNLEWEYQCLMLTELCCTYDICYDILKYLMNKIDDMYERIKTMPSLLLEISDQFFIEKIPYFIQITSTVLLKWKRYYKRKKRTVSNDTNKLVTNLWQIKWLDEENKKNDLEDMIIRNWKESLEKLVTITLEKYCLISEMFIKLIEIIDQILINSTTDGGVAALENTEEEMS
ncbi:hypothetical protein O3M35_007797 [Rhynocoris fuscipes]|uniref:Uncharacterized protein n=1 Tax=Rhynocoris fuscipes TaxID=488301 RepID=A0AAW1DHX2_9HEMI